MPIASKSQSVLPSFARSLQVTHPWRLRGCELISSKGRRAPGDIVLQDENDRSCSGIWLVPENLCVFLPNQNESMLWSPFMCLTRRCIRSSIARLVRLGRATMLCSRWKVSVSAHNVREIDQIVRENLTRNYTEYFRRYHKRFKVFKVCEVRIKHNGGRR